MTGKQLEKLKASLPKWGNGRPPVLTPEQEQLDKKLWCIEMINSILIYDGKNNIMENQYLQKYINELGLKVVESLVNEQIKDVEKAKVLKNVSIDYDGVSYNSIIWEDEQ